MKRQLIHSALFILTLVSTSVFGSDKTSYSGIMAVPTYYNAADVYDAWGEIYNNSSNRTLNVMLPIVKDKPNGKVSKGYVAIRDRHPSRNAWCAFVGISRSSDGKVSYYQSAGVYSKNSYSLFTYQALGSTYSNDANDKIQRLQFENLKKQPYEVQTNHFLLQIPPTYNGKMSGLTSYLVEEEE